MDSPTEGQTATCTYCTQEIMWVEDPVVCWTARTPGSMENPRVCYDRLDGTDHEPLDTPPPLDATDEVMAWLEH